jgi:hypothetical protein
VAAVARIEIIVNTVWRIWSRSPVAASARIEIIVNTVWRIWSHYFHVSNDNNLQYNSWCTF